MAKEKKETKKTSAAKPKRMQANVQASSPAVQEEVYPAINIANIYGLSDFAFYMIKSEKNIDDGTLMTINDFERYMKEVIRR